MCSSSDQEILCEVYFKQQKKESLLTYEMFRDRSSNTWNRKPFANDSDQ